MNLQLADQLPLVTASTKGIGHAIARALAAEAPPAYLRNHHTTPHAQPGANFPLRYKLISLSVTSLFDYPFMGQGIIFSGGFFVFALRLVAHDAPVFLPDVLVDLDRQPFTVQAITTVFSGTGNPIGLSGFLFVVVRLESAPVDSLKCLALIVHGFPCLRKGDAANARRARQFSRFTLDIHDFNRSFCSGLARGVDRNGGLERICRVRRFNHRYWNFFPWHVMIEITAPTMIGEGKPKSVSGLSTPDSQLSTICSAPSAPPWANSP